MPVTFPDPRARRSRLTAVLAAMLMATLGRVAAVEAQTASRTPTPVPTVTATPILQRVVVSPLTAKRQIGQTQSFTTLGFYSDGSQKNLTQKVIYSSSDLNVVFPPNAVGDAGRVQAVGVGTAIISATEPSTGVNSNTTQESATMEVVEAPTPTPTSTAPTPTRTFTPVPTATATPKLLSLTLAPATTKRNVGQTQNFSCTGTYSDGSQKNLTQAVTYASSNSNVASTPNQDGNKGLVLATGAGVATISASHPSGVSTTSSGGSAEFTVVVPPTPTPTRTGTTPTRTLSPTPTTTATPVLVALAVAPQTAKRQVGQVQNFSATGIYSDGSEKNLTQKVIYSSSDLNVVFPPNAVGNAGRVEAVGIGTAIISATEPSTGINSDATQQSATMEVVEAPTPTPTSTAPTPTRTFTPVPTATATPKLLSLTLAPATTKRNVGQTQNFSCTGTYSDGSQKNLTQAVTYASSNSNVASTPNQDGNKGLVLATGAGVATISASHPSGVSTTSSGGSAEFTVVVPPTPTPTRTGTTPTRTLSPTPTTTATPVLVSLALAPQTAKRGIGTAQIYTVTGTLSDGSTKNLTQRATYFSSDPSIASAPNDPNNKSRVLALSPGTAIISAVDTLTGIGTEASGGNASLEVVIAPTPTPTNTGSTPTRTKTPTPTPTATPKLVSIAISPLTVKKPVGGSQGFSVQGTYSDGNTKNLTQKVDYISSNPAVASAPNLEGNKGQVLAVGPGVATISAKGPATGIVTPLEESATFTVTEAPTPTPTRTGPTSTAPSPTPTLSGSPSPTATPVLMSIALTPQTAQKPVGGSQNFTANGLFSDGMTRNVTQRVTYTSSDPTVASAPNDPAVGRSKVFALKVGTAVISATDPSTGVVSTVTNGDATITVVEGNGTPNPRVTATPGLPVQTGNPTTACQRDVRRAARTFVDKKLKTLERCGSGAARCVQRKPDDPGCVPGVRTRCAAAFTKLAGEEARLIATIIRRCAGLSSTDVLGAGGLAYGDLAASCAAHFGRPLTDLTSVAQCVAAQHSCRAETLFALERPRAGELLRLVEVAPDAGACREDFDGTGLGVGDPKGVAKVLERCVQALVRGGALLARSRLASIGRCVDSVFLCVEADPGNAACLTKATQKCAREFSRVQRDVGKLTVTTGKRCNQLDFTVLTGSAGAYLGAVTPQCPDYGIPMVNSVADYVACLVRQHECEVADLVRFESPRAAAMLDVVGRTLVEGTCPAP